MADNLEDIFNVSGFNLQSISAEVKDAVNALNTLEDATQSAGKSTLDMGKKIDGLSVAKSISEFKSLSDTIRNTFNGSGIDNNKLDAIIANFTNDIPKLKGFLKDLKNQMVQLDGFPTCKSMYRVLKKKLKT
jgi:archaellum component FlaC